jgi:hypothetical protein
VKHALLLVAVLAACDRKAAQAPAASTSEAIAQ